MPIISVTRLKNAAAILGFSALGNLNSITAVRECSGGIILFLKLQVRINLQFAENSSMNALNAGCVELGFR